MIRSFHKGIKYECLECKKLFTSKENLGLHQKTTHHIGDGISQSLEHDTQDPSSESRYPETEEIENSTDDIEPTLTEKPNVNTFSSNSNDSQKDFSCEHCDKLFETKQAYDLHLKMAHEREKLFMCTVCDKSFSQQTALKTHMAIHEVSS